MTSTIHKLPNLIASYTQVAQSIISLYKTHNKLRFTYHTFSLHLLKKYLQHTYQYSPTAMAGLTDLSTKTKSTSLKDMMILLFEQDNDKDFKLVQETHTLCQELCDRVRERAEVIKQLESFSIIALARDSLKLLHELQDADLAKTRAMMKLISETQLRVLKKIAFVSVMGKK